MNILHDKIIDIPKLNRALAEKENPILIIGGDTMRRIIVEQDFDNAVELASKGWVSKYKGVPVHIVSTLPFGEVRVEENYNERIDR